MSTMDDLVLLLGRLGARDHATRTQAERALFGEWLEGGDARRFQLLGGLAQLAAAGDPQQRSFAAVILRRMATRMVRLSAGELERAADSLKQDELDQVRQTLLDGMMAPVQVRDTRHKIADAVAEFAQGPQPWPQLLVGLAQAAKASDSPDTRECAFRVFSSAPQIVQGSTELIQGATRMLAEAFQDPSEDVRVQATGAFASFFQFLPKSSWQSFKPLLPALLNIMEPLRVNHQDENLAAVLESLVELADLAPKMFKPVFADIVKFGLAVSKDSEMSDGTRSIAIELLITFAEVSPKMCRQESTYASSMVVSLLQLLVEVGIDDDDGAEWNAEDDPEVVDDEEVVHSSAKIALDRLALALGGEPLAGPLFQYLPQMAQSPNWRERHACLIALSNVAEGCREVLLPELTAIVNLILPLLQDSHCRVQWAACNALGQLSTDFAPDMQNKHSQEIMPALISMLNTRSVFKVQAHAAAAVVNFAEQASTELLEPYLDSLLEQLLTLLQGPKRYVQEQVLTTIAIVADAAKAHFAKYCNTLMPMLLQVLQTETPPEFRMLKGKAVECVSLIAAAIGRELFMPYFNQAVQLFGQLQQEANQDPEDPCQSYLAQAWGRVCRVAERDFLPYLPAVLPPLLETAKAKADLQILDDDQAPGEGWEVVNYSGQWVGVHTALYEDKASSMDLLGVYASVLCADFYTYVPDIIQEVVIPGLVFFVNFQVRYSACDLVHPLMKSAYVHFQLQQTQASSQVIAQQVQPMWLAILEKLMQQLANADDQPGMSAEVYTAIFHCVNLLGQVALPPAVIKTLTESIHISMVGVKPRVEARARAGPDGVSGEGAGDGAGDEDDDEYSEGVEPEEAAAEDSEVLEACSKLLRALLKTFKSSYFSEFEVSILPILQQSLVSSAPDIIEWGLDVTSDLLECVPQEAWRIHEIWAPSLVRILQSDQAPASVKHAAVYAAGAGAQHVGSAYGPLVVEILQPLFTIAQLPRDSDDEDVVYASENAAGALAKVLRFHGSQLPADQLNLAIQQWLTTTMPITGDRDPASHANLYLAELIQKKQPAVTQNVQSAFTIAAKGLASGNISDKSAEVLVTALKGLLSELPAPQPMELLQSLPPKEQEVIQKLFS